MNFTASYDSPLGEILLAADELGLTGLWFVGQKYYAQGLSEKHEEKALPVFDETRRWLEIYFSGREPDFMPALHLIGSDFRVGVWTKMLAIPYGKTTSYGELARAIQKEGVPSSAAARAVGGAVGHNRISIIVPCHRVIGADGSLTGYAGGIERKIKLLALEGIGADKR